MGSKPCAASERVDHMAYKDFDGLSADTSLKTEDPALTLHIDGNTVALPDASYVRDADFARDGMDLVLKTSDGSLVIKNYFAAEPTPHLVAPNGETLSPELVQSFVHGTLEYAQAATASDASPVGAVHEVNGEATVRHLDGTSEKIILGTPIFQGDVIETGSDGAVNIAFIDETTFAVSEGARLAIDEYVFDPSTQTGTTDFSVLKGVFVFTSGLIGREDPDDVHINTPVGSIGIRGTIILGDTNTGEITVVEGAIVLRDFQGHEVTLANQFETAKFLSGGGVEEVGRLSAEDIGTKFASISKVAPSLFATITDSAEEQSAEDAPVDEQGTETPQEKQNQDENQTEPQLQLLDLKPQPVAPQAPEQRELPKLLQRAPEPEAHEQQQQAQAQSPVNPTDTSQQYILPPLQVQAEIFGINENRGASQIIARLHGDFSAVVNYTLFGPNAGQYQLERVDETTVLLRYTGDVGDYDTGFRNLPPVGYRAINGRGDVVTGSIVTPVLNVNEAPIDVDNAPEQYFRASAGNHWMYQFDRGIRDPDKGDTLTFALSAATLATLNDTTGGLGKYLNLDMGGGDGWSFDEATGKIELWFKTAITTSNTFNLEFMATDAGGLSTNVAGPFEVIGTNSTFSSVLSLSNKIISTNDGDQSVTVTGNNNKIFVGDGNDTINLSADNNFAHLGDGNDTVNIDGTSNDNTIIGGYGNDTFNIQNGNNKIYGMDGDDSFALDSTAVQQLETGGSFQLIDGGFNAFRFLNLGDGRGDSILLNSSVHSISFTAILDNGNHIQEIERIDARTLSSTTATEITLNYEDVLAMTNEHRTLIFAMDASDSLTFDAQGHTFVKTGDDVAVNDQVAGTTADAHTYDVYTDGNVTLLVDSNATAANITGLPA